MKKILLIATALGMMSCEVVPPKSTATEVSTDGKVSYDFGDGYFNVYVVNIDGCQYLFRAHARNALLTHKGNCTNFIHSVR